MKIALMIVLTLTAVFLILLVLVQRGRGGGLAGALGGMGGQSEFGAKAGDLFTRITIGVAAFWILLCMLAVKTIPSGGNSFQNSSLGGTAAPAAATEPSVNATLPPIGETKGGDTDGATTVPASGGAVEAEDAATSVTPVDEDAAPTTDAAPAAESASNPVDVTPVEPAAEPAETKN